MDHKPTIEEMINLLDSNEEIMITDYDKEIFIESIDDKEGYSYVSNTNEEFKDSRDAIEWAVEQFNGIENICNIT